MTAEEVRAGKKKELCTNLSATYKQIILFSVDNVDI